MKYSIHDSRTDEILISSIELPADQIENLSSDTPEGHFRAAGLEELTEAGIDPEQIVFAIERGEAQAIAGIPCVPAPITPARDLLARVQATPAGRSAWSRAVHTYAVELVESLTESDDLSNETLLRKALLNGADDWQQYSEGGCALVYDADIAERLCSPSALKRYKGGERQPNASETWIDCQARALFQASRLIRRAFLHCPVVA